MQTNLSKQQDITQTQTPNNVQEITSNSAGEIESAKYIVRKVLEREKNFLDRFFPSKDIKIRNQKNAELIEINLSDRNELFRMAGQVMRKNFAESANVYLSDQMVQGKVFLSQRLSEGIVLAAEKFETEQNRLMNILQRKADTTGNWTGSLKSKFEARLDPEVDKYLDIFENVKYSLLKDLESIKDQLIKAI